MFNTIGNLNTQDRQVACFANAAAHLEPGGCFVVEVGVPDLRRLPPGDDARVFSHAPGYVGYDRYSDLVAQQAVSHHFVANDSGIAEVTTPFRYVWPSELDLMAALAGLTLCDRWSGWDRAAFTGDSPAHVCSLEEHGETVFVVAIGAVAHSQRVPDGKSHGLERPTPGWPPEAIDGVMAVVDGRQEYGVGLS